MEQVNNGHLASGTISSTKGSSGFFECQQLETARNTFPSFTQSAQVACCTAHHVMQHHGNHCCQLGYSHTVQHCASNGGDTHFSRCDASRVLFGQGLRPHEQRNQLMKAMETEVYLSGPQDGGSQGTLPCRSRVPSYTPMPFAPNTGSSMDCGCPCTRITA